MALSSNSFLSSGFWLIEILAAKSEYSVRARAIILPGYGCSQFHQLRSGKPLLQSPTQLLCNFRRRGRQGVRQFQYELFIGREKVAVSVPVEVADLFVAQPCVSATGRVNVDSKRTLHQLGCANLPQYFQLRRDKIGLLQRHAEFCVWDQDVRMRGNRFQRSNIFTQPLPCELADQRYL
jgi:hypothetical protein